MMYGTMAMAEIKVALVGTATKLAELRESLLFMMLWMVMLEETSPMLSTLFHNESVGKDVNGMMISSNKMYMTNFT